MNRKWKLLYFAMIGFLGFMIARGEAVQEKMCWAHYVAWGFNQTDGYDLAMRFPGNWMLRPFGDRSLLGKNIQWDSGIFFGARRQIETALAYGINGFCVDVLGERFIYQCAESGRKSKCNRKWSL